MSRTVFYKANLQEVVLDSCYFSHAYFLSNYTATLDASTSNLKNAYLDEASFYVEKNQLFNMSLDTMEWKVVELPDSLIPVPEYRINYYEGVSHPTSSANIKVVEFDVKYKIIRPK